MKTKTGVVAAFLDSHAPAEKDRRHAALITAAAELAEAALRGAGPAPYDGLEEAIAAAIGRRVDRVIADTTSDEFDAARHSVARIDSLGYRLEVRHWPRIKPQLAAAFGSGLNTFKSDAWRTIIRASRPQLSLWDDAFDPPKYSTASENMFIALFYYISYAAVGDEDNIESLANLVSWLPYVVPIGERPAGSGEWLITPRTTLP